MGFRDRMIRWAAGTAVSALLGSSPAGSTVYGPLDNFDVVNDTGHETCGFEIELEGVHSADIYRTFEAPYIRYATPTITDTPIGVRIRYQGTWNPTTHTFSPTTPPAAPGYVPASDSCWTVGLGAAYAGSGCEHFGVSQTTQETATHYRWLECHPDGTVTPLPDISLPSPTWTVSPPAIPGNPPVVRAEIEIPNPEGTPYGEAFWVKIYKTEAPERIELERLLLDDPLMANAPVEIEWELLQARPGHGMAVNEGPAGAAAEAVVRRYEFYRYNTAWGLQNGYVDPENGEVQECVVDGCNDPTLDEMGDFVGRQMAGFNIPPPACSNGVDDDGDGLADYPTDPGCRDSESSVEDPQCQDGIDNDGLSGTDFDGGASLNGGTALDVRDPQCLAPWNTTETAPSCGFGWEVAPVLVGILAARKRRRRA